MAEFEQEIIKFGEKDRIVTYSLEEGGKRGEPVKSWEPTNVERLKVKKAMEVNPQKRAIFKVAE